MGKTKGWDLVAAVDEHFVADLADAVVRSAPVKKKLDGFSKLIAPKKIPLTPTPFFLETSAELSLVERDGRRIKLDLRAVGPRDLEAYFGFLFRCDVRLRLLRSIGQGDFAKAGTFFECTLTAAVRLKGELRTIDEDPRNERVVMQIDQIALPQVGLEGGGQLPPEVLRMLEELIGERLRETLKSEEFPLTGYLGGLINLDDWYGHPNFFVSQPPLRSEYLFREYPRGEEAHSTIIMVAAYATARTPDADVPNENPFPLAEVASPSLGSGHAAVMISQRLISAMRKFYLPVYIRKKLWADKLTGPVGPSNDALFRFRTDPDTLQLVIAVSPLDEVISIDYIKHMTITKNSMQTVVHMHVCKSGFWIIGAPDPDYDICLKTGYEATSDGAIALKDPEMTITRTDNWFEKIVGGIWNAIIDSVEGVLAALRGDFMSFFARLGWVVMHLLGPLFNSLLSAPISKALTPLMKDAGLDKPIQLKWVNDEIAEIAFVGEASYHDGANSVWPANLEACVQFNFEVKLP